MADEGRPTEDQAPRGVDLLKQPRSLAFAVAGTVLAAIVLTIVVAVATSGDDAGAGPGTGVVGAATETPFDTPTDTLGPTPTDEPDASIDPTGTTTGTPAQTQAPTVSPTASSIASTPSPTATNAPTQTPTVGDGPAVSTPVASTPIPGNDVTAAADDFASQIGQEYGVRVQTDGQYWGATETAQMRNLGAVATALASLPPDVLAAINANIAGPLVILSNNHGRTEDGWQPYGDRAANFYSNEDRGDGFRAANQIVLQPGSSAQTIAHEMFHGYQMRDQNPGEYVAAMLTPEMKSFMAATGWVQLVSDQVIQNSANGSWETVNQYFRYDGRQLNYVNEFGNRSSLFAPNPLEAYAEAAGLYYAHADGITLPDWPDYWDWFDENLG